jgi:hypothetical protein
VFVGAWRVGVANEPSPGPFGLGFDVGDFFVASGGLIGWFMAPFDQYSSDQPHEQGPFDVFEVHWSSTDVDASVLDYEISPVASPISVFGNGSMANLRHPIVSADGLTLFVSIVGDNAVEHIFSSVRESANAGFATTTTDYPVLNSVDGEYPNWISQDECRLYMSRKIDGQYDIYVATRSIH